MKAITPIIAIIVLLLITIAIAGSAWTFISTMTTGYTTKVIQSVDSFCSGGYATIVIKNVGTDPIAVFDKDAEPYGLDSDTVALYHMEGNVDDETLVNDGIIVGGVDCDVEGKFRKGCEFDGTNYVNVSSIDALKGNSVTISAWVYVNSFTGSWNPIVTQYNSSNWGFYLYVYTLLNPQQPAFYLGCGSWIEALSPEQINTGQWYHLAGTYDGLYLRVYVDGTEMGSAAASCSGADTKAHIGYDSIGAPQYFDGTIDEVRIHNRALSPEEVYQLAQEYPCSGTGTSQQCGDVTITKTSGSGFNPFFEKGAIKSGESVTIRDQCVDERCKYRISTSTITVPVTLNC
jgi:flagellin-like protein